jgi:hypothetical protein
VDRDELLDIERKGWDALCEGSGADFYGRVMTDDGLMVLANGMVMDRGQVVEALGQSSPWSSYELADVRLVVMGDGGAALVYLGTAQREDGEPFVGAMASVYQRVGGEWRLALYQQTPVAQG